MNSERTAVVTGASSGVGFEVAVGLARDGFKVIALGRTAGRIEASRSMLAGAVPEAKVDWLRADLSVMGEVEASAGRIADLTDRVDVLVNNAGQTLEDHIVTVDGLEQTFAGNVIAPFLLTGLLLPLIAREGMSEQPGHVITTASIGHSYVDDMRWDDLQLERSYDGAIAYLQSKLANILFARELARRHPELVSSAVHPGTVDSRFPDTAGERTKTYFASAAARGELVSPKEAADTILWLAGDVARALPSGGYFHQREREQPSAAATNRDSAVRLWRICEGLTGVPY